MDKRIHVFEVTKSTGGVGEYVRWIANGLDKARFRLTVACLSEGGKSFAAELNRIPGVEAFSLPMARYSIAPLSDLRALWKLRAVIGEGGFDLIHAHASKPGFLARLAAAGSGVPVLYSPHCFAFHAGANPLAARLYVWLERWAARWLTARIVAVAQAERDLGCAHGVGRKDQYAVIHSGIDPRPFSDPFDRAGTRASLGVPESAPVVGVVGRLSRQKNPLGFLDAARRVHQQNPDAHFVWVGDGPLMEATRQRARALGLEEVFRLVGARRDIPAVLHALDLFALPSLWEAFPITILEAMAAGLPCVATRVQGVPEAVVDGETGLLVPPGDAGVLAQALLTLLADGGQRTRMGAAGRRRLETHFRREQMLSRLAMLYEEAVKNASQVASNGGEHRF